VAWVRVQTSGHRSLLVAVDPSGRERARVDPAALGRRGSGQLWRSVDGATLVTAGPDAVTALSALDGTPLRTYGPAPGNVLSAAFSPDARWLALLALAPSGPPALAIQAIDLRTGVAQTLPVTHDPGARLPGTTSPPGGVAWGLVVFGPDSERLYALTDWGGPARLTAFNLAAGRLTQVGTALDGQDGRALGRCSGPAMAARVVGGGKTLVAFCHMDGAVWFVDLPSLRGAGVVRSQQANPFWLSPIFTPDGHLLYLHQWPAFGDAVQVIDLATRRLLGPLATPTRLDQPGPFAWLGLGAAATAHAGGVASTVPLSPDGLRLYLASSDGVLVLRVPDLQPLARLAPGFATNEAWVSGDGRTIYATAAEGGDRLLVVRDDGGGQQVVSLPGAVGGFVAPEHG
jgi:hypothetical protein